MSGLLDIVTSALADIDVDDIVGVEVANLNNIAATVAQLTEGQPQALNSFVQAIAETNLPTFDFVDELLAKVVQVRDIIPTDMADVFTPVNDALARLDGGLGEGVTEIIAPLVDAFKAIEVLVHTDFNFSPTLPSAGGGAELASKISLVSSNANTQINPARLQTFGNVIDQLPADPRVGNLLRWFNESVTLGRTGVMAEAIRSIPYLDDIRTPVQTLLAWQSMTVGDLQDQLVNTLETLAQAIANQTNNWLAGQLQELIAIMHRIDLVELRELVLAIQARLDELKTLIDTQTLTEQLLADMEAAVNALIVRRDALIQVFYDDIKEDLENQLKKVAIIPQLLDENMSALLLLLQPPAALTSPAESSNFPPSMPAATAFDGLEGFLDQYTEVFENLMAALDVSVITAAFEQPAELIDSAVVEVDEAITLVTLELVGRLTQVEGLIASVDLANIVSVAEQAIETYISGIVDTLNATFAPVRAQILAITQQISTLVNTFDPASVIASIQAGIDSLVAALAAPEISNALLVVEKLKSIANRLAAISFTPVTDEVVGSIDEMSKAVLGLGNNLQEPLSGLLKGALDVLPDDLHPATDPLVAGLGALVDAGPISLLEEIKPVPQMIVDAINQFNPAELVGDSLSAPFQALLTALESIEPDLLLDPIIEEIEALKSRLQASAKPGQLLDPLITVHEQILTDLEGFNPLEIIEPINEALKGATEKIAASIPIAGVFSEIEQVIADIQRILGVDGVADSIIALVEKIRDYLRPFVEATESISDEIQSWLSDALAVVEGIDIDTLQTGFMALSDAIDETQASALQAVYDTAVEPLNEALSTTLQPGALMTALVKSHTDCKSSSQAMSDSLQKDRVETLLLRLNPTLPDFAAVFTAYGRIITTVADTQSSLQSTLVLWDDTYHQFDGILASYREVPTTPQALKQWLIDALDSQLIQPLQSLFEKFAPTAQLLDAFIAPLVELINQLRDTVERIIAAPAALVAVGESLQQILERLQAINLDFITGSILDVYNAVKTQFRGLNPRGLKTALDDAFNELLETISVDQIIPVDALEQVDDDIDTALEGLRVLDPQILIIEVIQPAYEAALAPFLAALDLTPTIETLVDRLGPIQAELAVEMDRVNVAYQGFKQSTPV
ncbi:MAG: hypothetical protein KUG79_13875 [Pseudomonadales bacterium]|nr:hypothetical protein [Pseudomonadales bacterium]